MASDGASGGGATVSMGEAGQNPPVRRAGGQAIYGTQGHDGGTTWHVYGAAGGGGAGGPGGDTVAGAESTPTVGGVGCACSISGDEVWYAGGGAGYRPGRTLPAVKGGGGICSTDASKRKGTDGLGGGGAGDAPGGSGVVIIRYRRLEHGLVILVR